MGKKKFIDKKRSTTYYLSSGPQVDPEPDGEGGPVPPSFDEFDDPELAALLGMDGCVKPPTAMISAGHAPGVGQPPSTADRAVSEAAGAPSSQQAVPTSRLLVGCMETATISLQRTGAGKSSSWASQTTATIICAICATLCPQRHPKHPSASL